MNGSGPRLPAGEGASGGEVLPATGPSDRAILRDLVIFQIKLFLDGIGDVVLAPLSVVAYLIDLIPGRKRGKLFYRILRLGERWDRWLSLYRPAHQASMSEEGLLGSSQIGADTFLGKVEEVVSTKAPLRPGRSGRKRPANEKD